MGPFPELAESCLEGIGIEFLPERELERELRWEVEGVLSPLPLPLPPCTRMSLVRGVWSTATMTLEAEEESDGWEEPASLVLDSWLRLDTCLALPLLPLDLFLSTPAPSIARSNWTWPPTLP